MVAPTTLTSQINSNLKIFAFLPLIVIQRRRVKPSDEESTKIQVDSSSLRSSE